MMNLTFRQIEVLHALLSAQGLTAGADRLNIPQSNASAILVKAHRLFDDPLLVRSKSGMSFTEEGNRVLEACSRVIASLSSLHADRSIYDPCEDDGRLLIAAVDYMQAAILARGIASVCTAPTNRARAP